MVVRDGWAKVGSGFWARPDMGRGKEVSSVGGEAGPGRGRLAVRLTIVISRDHC